MSVNKYNATQDLLLQIAGNGSEGSFHRTTPVSALSGATSVTITDSRIHTTSLVFPFADNGTNESMSAPSSITLSEGQCVLTFDALEADTDFTLVILADSLTEDAYLNDLTDVNISSPSNNQVLGYNGTTGKWVNVTVPEPYTITTAVSALTGATSCTITNANIHTTSLIEPFASVQGMGQPTMTITEGECLLEFPELAQDTSFRLRITN